MWIDQYRPTYQIEWVNINKLADSDHVLLQMWGDNSE